MVLTEALTSWMIFISLHYNINPLMVAAVIDVESNSNPNKIGELGEVGLMQIRPEYQEMPKHLMMLPAINIMVGARELHKAQKQCRHQKDNTWIVCYNYGIVGGSRLRNPKQSEYYRKIMKVYIGKNW